MRTYDNMKIDDRERRVKGQLKIEVLEYIHSGIRTPNEIARHLNYHVPSGWLGQVLQNLRRNKLIKSTPNLLDMRQTIYKLTERGLKELQELTN